MNKESDNIINKVALSGIEELNLQQLKPTQEFVVFDIKNVLYEEFVLREKEFRATMAATDWSVYQNKVVVVQCTNDAIVPQWAYMLLASYLKDIASHCTFASLGSVKEQYWIANIQQTDFTKFKGKRVTLKADSQVPEAVYMAATKQLIPLVKTLMYGEPGLPKVIFKQS